MVALRENILLPYTGDVYDKFRKIYNDIIEDKIIEGRQGIEQERYLTLTIERKNFEEAKAQFATLEATIHKAFIELGAEIVPLLPNGTRSDFSDDVSLEEFQTEEKCLLYVALTRARKGAYITCYGKLSELIV